MRENVEEIDFELLHDSFVLKAIHGLGWVIVCKNMGEFVYKNIPARIISEDFLSNEDESAIVDYKIYRFKGVLKFLHVDMDSFQKHTRDFYDLDWNRLPFGLCYLQSQYNMAKPNSLNEMNSRTAELSKPIKFVQVDLYFVKNKIYFGELAFYPSNGLEVFNPPSMDYELGKLINL